MTSIDDDDDDNDNDNVHVHMALYDYYFMLAALNNSGEVGSSSEGCRVSE
jgi:hypothetical protein